MALEGIESRSVDAGVKMLELKGAEVLDKDFMGFVVSRDEDCMAFCSVRSSEGVFEGLSEAERDALVKRFEEAIVEYFKQADAEPDVSIRLDAMNVVVISSDRAVIKHTTNVCNER